MSAGDIKYEHSAWVVKGSHDGSDISLGDILNQDGSDDWTGAGGTASGVIGVALDDAETDEDLRVLRSGVVEVDGTVDISSADNAFEIPEYPGEVETDNMVIYLM